MCKFWCLCDNVLSLQLSPWLSTVYRKANCKKWMYAIGSWNANKVNVLQYKTRVQIWHFSCNSSSSISISQQMGKSGCRYGTKTFPSTVKLESHVLWRQRRPFKRPTRCIGISREEWPVEEFTIGGLCAGQMLDPRGPDVTGPNEVLVNIAKNVCSCAISEEH